MAENNGNGEMRLLELVDISVHYGAVIALDQASLGVERGEVVAVMGPNGAGKSTVLRAIMGLAPVVGGKVYWQQNLLQAETHEIVKEGISFVPQGRRVFTHLTIEENLEMGCLYLNDSAEKRRRLDGVMELFPILHEKRKDYASQMSGGQQQMLALGRGLMADAKLYLADEPSLGLAPKIGIAVMEALLKIDLEASAMIIAEQNVALLEGKVDRVIGMHAGKLKGEASSALTMQLRV